MGSFSKILLGMIACYGWVFSPAGAENTHTPSREAVEQAKLATVGILQGDPNDTAERAPGLPVGIRGSGIHLGNGVIVTARHAVERSEGRKVGVPDTIHVVTDDLLELPAVRQGSNAFMDVVVYALQAPESEWPAARVEFADQDVTYGDHVFTVGYPLGWGPAITFGRTGNPNTFLATVQSRLVQVDLSACRGNSGGGLLNQDGRIVGLLHAIIQMDLQQEDRRCSRLAFALPGPLVQRVVKAVQSGKVPGFSRLGLHLHTVREGNRWTMQIAEATGPSRHAGFRKGDTLLAINDVTVTTPAQLKNYLIERTEPGQTVKLRVQRGDQQEIVPVILGSS